MRDFHSMHRAPESNAEKKQGRNETISGTNIAETTRSNENMCSFPWVPSAAHTMMLTDGAMQ